MVATNTDNGWELTVETEQDLQHIAVIKRLEHFSDRGKRRPGIKGTMDKLATDVHELLVTRINGDVAWHPNFQTNGLVGAEAAVRLIEFKIREAYKIWEAA